MSENILRAARHQYPNGTCYYRVTLGIQTVGAFDEVVAGEQYTLRPGRKLFATEQEAALATARRRVGSLLREAAAIQDAIDRGIVVSVQ